MIDGFLPQNISPMTICFMCFKSSDCDIDHCYCRYLHERFSQLQEEVNLLKSNIMKYKVQVEGFCLNGNVKLTLSLMSPDKMFDPKCYSNVAWRALLSCFFSLPIDGS